MDIIPVIDLLGAQVVRGLRGERGLYRAIESKLCRSADPQVVAERLCEHCATDTLYVADLDALQGRQPQTAMLARLLQARPSMQLWLDAGFGGLREIENLLLALERLCAGAAQRVTPVLASESLRSLDELRRCRALPCKPLLSLDCKQGAALDAAGVWTQPALWPAHLIVMTLDRVGSAAGPDLSALAAVRALAPRATLIGAGGVRDAADLQAAAAAGAAGWLLASALHDGGLPAQRRATVCDAGGSVRLQSVAHGIQEIGRAHV